MFKRIPCGYVTLNEHFYCYALRAMCMIPLKLFYKLWFCAHRPYYVYYYLPFKVKLIQIHFFPDLHSNLYFSKKLHKHSFLRGGYREKVFSSFFSVFLRVKFESKEEISKASASAAQIWKINWWYYANHFF